VRVHVRSPGRGGGAASGCSWSSVTLGTRASVQP
jgi:hypothetical protein